MITLPEDHPLVVLYDESFIFSGGGVFMLGADDPMPDPQTYLWRPRKGERQKVMLAVSAHFKHEQFDIAVMHNMIRYGDRDSRLMFIAAVTHPDHPTTYHIADGTGDVGCSAVTIPHPELGTNAFYLHYSDDAQTNKVTLSVVTKIATSMEQEKPVALSDSLISLLTSK